MKWQQMQVENMIQQPAVLQRIPPLAPTIREYLPLRNGNQTKSVYKTMRYDAKCYDTTHKTKRKKASMCPALVFFFHPALYMFHLSPNGIQKERKNISRTLSRS